MNSIWEAGLNQMIDILIGIAYVFGMMIVASVFVALAAYLAHVLDDK